MGWGERRIFILKKWYLVFSLIVLCVAILWREKRPLVAPIALKPFSEMMHFSSNQAALPSAKVKPPIKTEKESEEKFLSTTEMQFLTSREDVCGVMKSLRKIKNEQILEILAKSTDLIKRDSEENKAFEILIQNLTPEAQWSGDRISTGSSALDFFNALNLSQLVVGQQPPTTPSVRELKQAVSLLDSILDREPQNSAAAVYLAIIGTKLGDSAELTRTKLIRAFNQNEFESYVVPTSQRIFERGLSDPASEALMVDFYAQMPIPNYTAILNATLPRISSADLDFTNAAFRFGTLLMKPAIENSGKREVVNWLAIEHSVGRKIAETAWKVLHPGVTEPPQLSRSYREYMPDEVKKASDVTYEQMLENCDPEKWRAEFDRAKKEYLDDQIAKGKIPY